MAAAAAVLAGRVAGVLVAEEEASSGEESGSSSGAEEEEGGVEEEGEEEAAAEAGMGVWPKPLSRWASVESRGRARLRRVNRRLRRAEAAVLRQYAAWDLTQDASEQSAGVPSRLSQLMTSTLTLTRPSSPPNQVLSRLAFLAADAAVELSFR